jgi:hypothetical protein
MWILPVRYDKKEELFGISAGVLQARQLCSRQRSEVDGLFCSGKPSQKPVKRKI